MPTLIPRPANEAERLAAVRRYHLLDTPPEDEFNFLTEMAAALCQAPYAYISLIDEQRVWFKSLHGIQLEQPEAPRDDDYCSWTILEDVLLNIPDLTQDARSAKISLTEGAPHYHMYCGANLITYDGFRIGALCVLDSVPNQLSERQIGLLVELARQVMVLIELRAKEAELSQALAKMERLAAIDELTKLVNRRVLCEQLDLEVARATRFGTLLAVVLLDLDHFKEVNDKYGHAMGDMVLAGVAGLIIKRMRTIDTAGRYGGEELCLLLPGTDSKGALAVADALRQQIAGSRFYESGQAARVTASFGVAANDGGILTAVEPLFRAADRALYRAKTNGRNRVEPARPSDAL